MPMLPEAFATLFDLLLVVIGFSLIVVVHELGHFLAARWAKIRVLAFAVGFGPALVSWRKGLGLRRGSSEPEYLDKLSEALQGQSGRIEEARAEFSKTVSPTEYRINVLPLGGYVRMLGQEDLNPGAVSAAPDSYQSVAPWKRMVVISAGVIFNIIAAAVMFVLVFMIGLQVEPAKIGPIDPGSPADRAGLMTGDEVISVDGKTMQRFDDLALSVAMASPGEELEFVVRRPGVEAPVSVSVEPQPGRLTGMLEIGAGPAQTARVGSPEAASARALVQAELERRGFAGVEPGMRVVRAETNGRVFGEIAGYADLLGVYDASGGETVSLTFVADDGREVVVETEPEPEFQVGLVETRNGWVEVRHLAGLTPVLRVTPDTEPAQGLAAGDVFARLGSADFPGIARGLSEIRGNRNRPIELRVLRGAPVGEPFAGESVAIDAKVNPNGTIGFSFDDTRLVNTLLTPGPKVHRSVLDEAPTAQAAEDLGVRPGDRIVAVDGETVATLGDVRRILVERTWGATEAVEISLTMAAAPVTGAEGSSGPVYDATLVLSPEQAGELAELGWRPPISAGFFAFEQRELKAGNPVEAFAMGARETRRVMISAYVTFARLFQGTIKVEHLKGPVGIAHIGTLVAGRGIVWLVFFLALISVNLAVINFLPLPIVDGGQFLMLVYEAIARKPVPIPVQNGLTLVGLAMIGTVFLVVTFNDVRALFGI